MRNDTLPSNYSPPQSVRLFSNIIENVRVLFLVDRHVPILIGEKAGKPRVWLTAPVRTKSNGTRWLPLVRNNLAVHPAVVVSVAADGETVTVKNAGTKVLEVHAQVQDLNVSSLDLRPLGLTIYGDEDGLHVGGMRLTENRFSNLGVLVSNHDDTESSEDEVVAQAPHGPRPS